MRRTLCCFFPVINRQILLSLFNTTFRYLDDISAINNIYFDNIVGQIYPPEFQLNQIITFDTEVSF